MPLTTEQCEQIIISAYRQFVHNASSGPEPSRDTRLVGGDSALDSTALVGFLIEVEQQLCDTSGYAITLADDRAMSQTRSPFRSIGTLTDYAVLLLSESNDGR